MTHLQTYRVTVKNTFQGERDFQAYKGILEV